MDILFINRDVGCGVEFVGDLFIDILSHVTNIENIFVFKNQDLKKLKNIENFKCDLVIFNDFIKVLNTNQPTINMCFANEDKNSSIVINYNQLMVFNNSHIDIKNCLSLNFISGNIWKNITDWNKRSDDILYVSRFCESKIIRPFLEEVKKNNKIIDFYGPIIDREYYEEYKNIINYKGFINHKELVNVYNNYKSIYLFSTTECLSMTLSEALSCGCVPIIFDDFKNYSLYLGENCIKFCDINSFKLPSILDIKRKHKMINMNFISNFFSFDKMVLDFLFYLRGLLLIDFKFDRFHKSNINIIEDVYNIERKMYENDTVDWEKVLI